MTEITTHGDGTHVTVGSHVPAAMAAQLARLARANERSISGEVRLALRHHLAAARRTAGGAQDAAEAWAREARAKLAE